MPGCAPDNENEGRTKKENCKPRRRKRRGSRFRKTRTNKRKEVDEQQKYNDAHLPIKKRRYSPDANDIETLLNTLPLAKENNSLMKNAKYKNKHKHDSFLSTSQIDSSGEKVSTSTDSDEYFLLSEQTCHKCVAHEDHLNSLISELESESLAAEVLTSLQNLPSAKIVEPVCTRKGEENGVDSLCSQRESLDQPTNERKCLDDVCGEDKMVEVPFASNCTLTSVVDTPFASAILDSPEVDGSDANKETITKDQVIPSIRIVSTYPLECRAISDHLPHKTSNNKPVSTTSPHLVKLNNYSNANGSTGQKLELRRETRIKNGLTALKRKVEIRGKERILSSFQDKVHAIPLKVRFERDLLATGRNEWKVARVTKKCKVSAQDTKVPDSCANDVRVSGVALDLTVPTVVMNTPLQLSDTTHAQILAPDGYHERHNEVEDIEARNFRNNNQVVTEDIIQPLQTSRVDSLSQICRGVSSPFGNSKVMLLAAQMPNDDMQERSNRVFQEIETVSSSIESPIVGDLSRKLTVVSSEAKNLCFEVNNSKMALPIKGRTKSSFQEITSSSPIFENLKSELKFEESSFNCDQKEMADQIFNYSGVKNENHTPSVKNQDGDLTALLAPPFKYESSSVEYYKKCNLPQTLSILSESVVFNCIVDKRMNFCKDCVSKFFSKSTLQELTYIELFGKDCLDVCTFHNRIQLFSAESSDKKTVDNHPSEKLKLNSEVISFQEMESCITEDFRESTKNTSSKECHSSFEIQQRESSSSDSKSDAETDSDWESEYDFYSNADEELLENEGILNLGTSNEDVSSRRSAESPVDVYIFYQNEKTHLVCQACFLTVTEESILEHYASFHNQHKTSIKYHNFSS